MMKKLVAMMMVLTMVFSFSSCGGTKTLEDVVKDDPTYQEQLDSQMSALENDQMGIDIAIKENTVVYTFKFKQTFEESQLNTMKDAFAESMKTMGPQFETLAGTLEEESEVDGVTIQVVYLDGADTELYKGEFKSTK